MNRRLQGRLEPGSNPRLGCPRAPVKPKKNRRVSKNICEVAIWCRAKAPHPTSSYCHKRTFSQQAQTLWAAALWFHSTSYFRRERSITEKSGLSACKFQSLREKKKP